ncbi:MAG: DUF5801 repeats-in-toxin domain-containing protein [Devosia sp.]|uniref:T1SS-143 repeat domain-containing protein n=1 Tax=Devosia sp. TaxID=1871048 RepID=UPI003390D671
MVERIGNEEGIEFGANVEAAEPILVAQADTGTAAQPAPTPTAVETRVVVELEDGYILRLPATASVDQPRENGTDLEFVQADGTVIVVPNGAIQGLTIFIGDAEIPPLTVAALFESNGIEAAAGPAGAGASARGSGGNFEVPVGGIGDAFALGDLLDPTALAFGTPGFEDLYPANTKPSFLLGNYSFRISEEGLAAGLADFGPAGGADTTNDSFYFINLGAMDPDGDSLTFTLSAPTEGLTSNGGLIVWEGVGTNHLIGRVGGATVIDITIGGKSGLLIVQLLEPIDHPTGNTEDVLDLGLTVTANDGRGGTATATITIGIEDDSPEIGVSQSTGVDEDGLKGGVGDSASPGDNSGNAVTATGSLGIKWGADNGDKLDTLNEDGSFAQDSSGRSVYFSQANFLAFVENYGSLTSGGLPLVFSWTGNTITASVVGEGDESSQLIFKISLSDDASGSYKFQLFGPLDHEPNRGQQPGEGGSDLPPSEGEMQAKIAGEGDDDGDSYEDDIVLNFEFTAKDADGDTVGGNFAVTVDDDMPVLISNGERDNVRIVDEDDIRTALSQGTSPNDGAGDGSYTGNPATNGPGPAYIYGSLGGVVNFGADGPGGFAVNSGAIAKFDAYGLESHGDALMYSVKADATWATFTATAGEDGRTVFEFRVNVTTGDYEFRLYDQLDHDAPASGADQNFDLQNGEGFEDVFSLDFGAIVRAYDGDGDYVDLVDQLLVKVRDDVPELVRGKSEIRTVDEDDIRTIGDGVLGGSTGTSPNDGNADGSYTGSPYNNGPGAATITGSLAHLVRSGSDESLSFGFASENSVRSQLSALGLKSGGQTLSYDVQGNVLYGFVNANGIGQSYDVGEDRPVFKLTLNADGSYKFELIDQLDHDRGDGQNFDLQDSLANQDVSSINFGKVILATDNDGDSVSLNGAFQIKIRDDVPELIRGQSEIRTVDEDDIRTNSDGLPGGSTGTSPNANSEGQGDDSRTGSNGAAYVQGSLAHLVQSGADEGLTFGFVSENSVRNQLSALGLKSNGETLSYDVQGNVLYAFANKGGNIGQSYDVGDDRPVFKLTLNADGSYKFELIDQLDHDLGSGQNYGLQDSVPNQDVSSINFGKLILATDNDGDSVSLDGAFQIKIRDDVPELAKHGLVFGVVEEEQLSGGNEDTNALLDLDYDFGPWGQNYNVISTVASDNDLMSLKNLIVGGADENGKFSARAGITNSVVRDNDGNVVKSDGVNVVIKSVTSGTDAGGAFTLLTAAAGNNPVFTLKVYADGDWRFQLLDQLDHKADNLEDVLALDLAAFLKYTDFDGDSVNLDGESFLIKVIDDTPEASLKLKNGAKLILDETKADSPQDTSGDGNADDEKGIANPFSQSYGQLIGYAAGGSGTLFTANPSVGADQNGSTVYSLSISGNNDSGVDDTATGKNILLFKEGNDIVGRVGGSNGAVAFVIRADANTGEVKVYQFRAVEHDNDGSTQADHDESSSPEYLDANKITLTQTVTDEDGDKDTASVDLGKVIGFEDDGPKITKLELGHHTIVSHDETPGVNGDADDVYGALSIFNSVTNRGDDLDVSGSGAIGFAKEDNLISYGTNFGADGKASSNDTVFSLVLKGGDGQDSGLKTTEGAAIKLYLEHGIIVGRVGDASGKAAFAIAVDSDDGDISLVQYLSIQHPTSGSSHDESVGLDLADTNAIEVKLTIKDGDGDTDSKTVDISDSVRFQDDGPSIEVDRVKDHGHYAEPKSILLDETTPGGNPNDNTGNADWSLTTNPAAALAIGQVTSSASGNGSIASLFDIDVDGGADGVRSVVKAFSFDLRDDKGNLVTNNTTGVETTLKVTQVAGTALGGLDAGERTIWLYRLDDKTIIGKIFGDGEAFVALKIELTGTAENPQFTVTQYLPVDHPNSFDHDEGLSLKFDDKDASLSIKLTATVTDNDGDTATDSESVKIIDDKSSIVTIEDDGPTITGVTYATLGQELIQNGGFELGHGLNGANWDLFNSIPGWNAGTNVPFEVQSGGAGGVPNTNGAVVELDGDTQSNGTGAGNGTAVGATNASIQQVVSGTEAGQTYQLTFDVAPRSNGGVNTAGLEVYFGGTKVFPLNGQTVAADQWTTITLTVTAPTNNAVLEFRGTGVQDEYGALIDNVSVKAKSFGLDDESQAGGIVGGPGDDPSGKVLSGKINFDAGTDHLKAIVVDDNINVDAIWVDANGVGHRVDVDVKWIQDGQGGKLVGTMERGGETRPVFELVVNANGSFTLTMQAPLAHPYTDADGRNNGPETEWEDNLSLQFDYKVIDNDGDTASGSIKVSVDDDSPDFVGGIEDQTVQTLGQAVNGDLNINFGADGQYADKGLVISGYQNLPGVNEVLSTDGRTLTGYVGGTPVYQLKLNSNGTYDFTQFDKVPGVADTLATVSFDANFNAVSFKDYGEFLVRAVGNGNQINGSNSGPGGIGVGSNSGMEDGEKLEIVFDSQMTSVTLGINYSYSGAHPEDMEIDWVAYDQNGNVVAFGTTSDFDEDTSRTINPGVGFYKLVLTADDDSQHSPHPSVRISSLSGVKASSGNVGSLDFTVTAKDGDKDAQSDTFTVTLKTNTPPVITSASGAGSVTELTDGAQGENTQTLTTTGSLNFTDSDINDTHTVGATLASVTGAPSALGTFTPIISNTATGDGAGTIGWTFSVSDGALDYLAAGQTITQLYTVTLTDNSGTTSNQTVTVTITGTNDAPVINSAASTVTGSATEWADLSANEANNVAHTANGSVAFSDVDTIDTHSASFAAQANGYVGTFALGAVDQNGNTVGWTYSVADSAIDYLAAGQTLTQKYDVTVDDGKGGTAVQTITVTITGTNDAPIVAMSDLTGGVTEMETPVGDLTDGGTIGFTDVDLTDAHSITNVVASSSALGNLTASVTTDTTGSGLGGSITWNYSVNAASVEYLEEGQTKVESFTITLSDGHGGSVERTIDVTITGTGDGKLVIGSNQSDTSAAPSGNTNYDHFVPSNGTPGTDGVINGSSGNDVIAGDPGATPTIAAGASANVVLVLDTSSSLTPTQMSSMQAAVGALIQSLYNSGAANVRIALFAFGGGYRELGVFDLVVNGVKNSTNYTNALDTANADGSITNSGQRLYIGADPGSNTSYASGLDAVVDYLNPGGTTVPGGTIGTSGDGVAESPLSNATVNKVIFISDGEPSTNATQTQINTITGAGYTIEAVGLNVAGSQNAVNALNALDSGGAYTNVVNPSDLTGVVGSLAGSGTVQSAAGGDTINGGAGKDIIFGDVINTDALRAAAGLSAATYPAGSGWAVFAALEGTTTGFTQANDLAGNGAQWTRADTLAYIKAYHAAMAAETGRTGGNDDITGGAGDDTIYAQEGNDAIRYAVGDGNDVVDGGSGSDALYITNGSGAPVTVTLAAASGGSEINSTDGVPHTDIVATIVSGANTSTIRMDSIEDIHVDLGAGGGSVIYGASLNNNTALDLSTVHVTGGAGIDSLDLSARANGDQHRVVFDGGAGLSDVVKLDFKVSEITGIEVVTDGVKITHNGITDTFTNVESFVFEGETSGTVSKTLAEVKVIDYTAPTASLVSYGTNDGALALNESVTLTVKFSEAVYVNATNGMPALNLNNGGSAIYTGGSGTDTLTFTYTPSAGQSVADLALAASGISLNTATITDLAGNNAVLAGANGQNPAGIVRVDAVAPVVTISNTISTNGGIVPTITSGGTTRDSTLALSGTVSDTGGNGTFTVEIYDGATFLGTATVNAGNWTYTTSVLGNGPHSFTAKAIDSAGNVTTTAPVTASIDTVAPTAPTITSVTDNVGAIVGELADGARSDDTQLVVRVAISGTGAVANDTVQLYNGTTVLGNAVTLSAGDVANGYVDITTPTLTNNTSYNLRAGITDVAGNASPASASGTNDVTIDTTAPTAAVAITAIANDTGITGDFITSDTSLIVSGTRGTLNNGDKIQISTNGTDWFDVSTPTGSTWSYTDPTPRTSNVTYQVRVIDAAGNVGNADSQLVKIDTSAPTAPSITSVTDDVGTFTGALADGARSDDTVLGVRVNISGTGAVIGDTVRLYNGTTGLGLAVTLTSTNITNGYVDINTPTLTDGTSYNLRAAVIDVAGNISELSTSGARDVTIDTTAPVVSNLVVTETGFSFGASENISAVTGPAGITVNGTNSTQITVTPATSLANAQTQTITVSDVAGNATSVVGLYVGDTGADGTSGAFARPFTSGTNIIYGMNGNDYLAGGSGNDYMFGGDGNDKLIGGAGNDTLNGGIGNDILVGGSGDDKLTGGTGVDQFRLTTAGNAGNITTITDFVQGTDKIAFLDTNSTGSGSVNFAGTTGTTAGAALASSDFVTRSSIEDIDGDDDNHVVRITTAQTEDQIVSGDPGSSNRGNIYVVVFNSTSGKGEIWFDTNWADTGARVKVATLDSITSLSQLSALAASDFVVYSNAADPLVLDLDNNGYTFSSLNEGAAFDLDADGKIDQLAWNSSNDGILAYDVDGNGTIDNGSELFTPWFNGGNFVNGSAALASLDTNSDGVIDANDEAFNKLQIWQDLNGDGISDAGELKSLADHGITSLSASTAATNGSIDGQAIVGEGTFTRADGTTGGYVEVELDIVSGGGEAPVQGETIFGTDGDDFLVGTDGDDIIIGGLGNDTLTGGAGADTFVFSEAGPGNVDTITDFVADEDAIDLGALLDAALIDENNIGDYVRIQGNGSDGLLQVDTSGTGENWVDVANLNGHGTPGTVIDIKLDDETHHIPTI